MPDRLLYVGDHADQTAANRPLEPGDIISASQVDPKNPHDKRLLDDGVLVNLTAEKDALEDDGDQKGKSK